jgi:hypothetical protein
MSKVFISYKRVDRDKAAVIRARLEALQLPLFIDDEIPATENFAFAINTHLNSASAVLVLWTETSVKWPKPGEYNYVLAEAQYAADRHILVAVCVEKLPPGALPVPFNSIQAPDISDWIATGAPARHKQWQHALKALGGLVGRPTLGELAIVMEEGDAEAKRVFLRNSPDDPMSAIFAAELETIVRDEFEEQFRKAQARIDRRKTNAERKLTECRRDFERRLGDLRAGHHFMPPDPIHVLDDNVRVLEERAVFLKRQLEDEQTRAEEAERTIEQTAAEADSAKQEVVSLHEEITSRLQEIDSLKVALADRDRKIESLAAAKPAPLPRGGRRILPLLAAGAALAGLIVGIALTPIIRGALGIADNRRLAASAKDLEAFNSELGERERRVTAQAQALAKTQAELESQKQDLALKKAAADRKDVEQKQTAQSLATQAADQKKATDERERGLEAQEQAFATRRAELDKQQQNLAAQKAVEDRRDAEQKQAAQSLATRAFDQASRQTQLDTLQQDLAAQKTAADRRDAEQKKKADELTAREQALAQHDKDVTRREQDLTTGSIPAVSAAASQCDDSTAYQFDPDRPPGSKYRDDLVDVPDKAVGVCAEALRTAGNNAVLRRRLTVELGRAYAAQGRLQALASNEGAAKESYAAAVQFWNGAAMMGSGQAYNLLGSFFQGSFAVDRPTPLPRYEPQQPMLSKAWQNYLAAAKLKNPSGLVNAGVVLIGLDESFSGVVDLNETRGREYLETARDLGYPRAIYMIGEAMLKNKGYPKNPAGGLKLIAEAACKGDGGATRFFDDPKNNALRPRC